MLKIVLQISTSGKNSSATIIESLRWTELYERDYKSEL